jgi:hypothetical protein
LCQNEIATPRVIAPISKIVAARLTPPSAQSQ